MPAGVAVMGDGLGETAAARKRGGYWPGPPPLGPACRARRPMPILPNSSSKKLRLRPSVGVLRCGRVDVHHQLLAGALDRRDVALLVEANDETVCFLTLRIAEGDLADVARHIIPVVRRELAGKARTAERLFDAILVVDAGLDRADHLRIEHNALVHARLRAACKQHRAAIVVILDTASFIEQNLCWAADAPETCRLACGLAPQYAGGRSDASSCSHASRKSRSRRTLCWVSCSGD